MASCLGLYIEDNIIKYAKVSKNNDLIKIESFGLKFYDKLGEAIDQVIEETFSYKIPISINISNETYNYFHIFNLLNKKDLENYVKLEFESFCYDKEQQVENFETRYILTQELDDKEKIKAIHISANKLETAKRINMFSKYNLVNASPVPLSLPNLLNIKSENRNIAILNIEQTTTVTIIDDKKVTDIITIEDGTDEILNAINIKENSYAKAYELCKNSTIYTSEGKELQYEENVYLDDIMPTLYNIVGKVKKILNESLHKIEKVYITGTASVINNIDIYFQEYLEETKCEILRPYFINVSDMKINIKDYIEVNSAIALALQGLDEGIKGINFKKSSFSEKLPAWMKIEIGVPGTSKSSGSIFSDIINTLNTNGALSRIEKDLIRGVIRSYTTYNCIWNFIKCN